MEKPKENYYGTSLNGQTGVNYDNIRPLSTKISTTYENNNNSEKNFNLDLINVITKK